MFMSIQQGVKAMLTNKEQARVCVSVAERVVDSLHQPNTISPPVSIKQQGR